MKKKYLCLGGAVLSADGDCHKISAQKLPELYGVPFNECVFVEVNEPHTYAHHCRQGLIVLTPLSDGKYPFSKKD